MVENSYNVMYLLELKVDLRLTMNLHLFIYAILLTLLHLLCNDSDAQDRTPIFGQHQIPVCASVPEASGRRQDFGGQKGAQGVPGKKGPRGIKGQKGKQGTEGSKGSPGPRGEKGSTTHPRGMEGCPSLAFHFPRNGQTSDYVRYRGYVLQQSEGTVCAWVETNDFRDSYTSVISYSTTNDNEFLVGFNQATSVDYWAGSSRTSNVVPFPPHVVSEKFHLCAWYSKKRQRRGIYINAKPLRPTQSYNEIAIRGGGTLILGQEQDSPDAGSLDASQAFTGTITNFMIWPRVLSQQEINNIARNCECPNDYSLVMSLDKAEIHGSVTYSIPVRCPLL